MKYILTKDWKIHEVVLKQSFQQSNLYFVKVNPSDGSDIFGDFCYSREYILKEADTIEELCDEFVVVAEDNDKPFIYDLPQPVNSPDFDNKEETVYGAIWTDKGLIYVAKMNREGEFELIWASKFVHRIA